MRTIRVVGRMILAWVALGAPAFVAAAVPFALEPTSRLAPALMIFAAAGVAALALFTAWSKRGGPGPCPAGRMLPAVWMVPALAVVLVAAYLLWNPQVRRVNSLIRDLGAQGTGGRAFTALVDLGAAAAPPLIEALGDGDARVRSAAGEALVAIGQPAAPALVTKLTDAAYSTADVLAGMGEQAVGALIAQLGRKDLNDYQLRPVRYTLRRIGTPAVGRLAAAAVSADAQIREQALATLFAYNDDGFGEYDDGILLRLPPTGDEVERMAALLAAGMRDADARVRLRSLGCLKRLPWMAGRRLPLLSAALGDVAPAVRAAAAAELGAERDERTIGPLATALGDVDPGVRSAAALALAETGPGGARALAAAFSAAELDAAAAGFRELVARGQPGTEAVLIAALFARKENGMLGLFLDCGNGTLQAATYEYARQNGLTITYLQAPAGSQPGGGAAWGSQK